MPNYVFIFAAMMGSGKRRMSWIWLLIGFALVQLMMFVPGAGEFYARHLYPAITAVLSFPASFTHLSFGCILLYLASFIVVLVWLIRAIVKHKFSPVFVLKYVVTIYVWFYLSWGICYSRDSIYERADLEHLPYDEEQFTAFLYDYSDSINSAYCTEELSKDFVQEEVYKIYNNYDDQFGLCKPLRWKKAKNMMFEGLTSKMGISGYYYGFFGEFHINGDCLPFEYPFVYAHEYSHSLGVANEAEANLHAYIACTSSSNQAMRYAGYLGLFGYIYNNASQLLSQEAASKWLKTIRPEVVEMYFAKASHWESLYSQRIGKIQSKVYNAFLKSNGIPSGTKNYSEVVSLLMAL